MAVQPWRRGAIAGLVGGMCYGTAILVDWPETQFGTATGVLVASAWPILSIVFFHTLHDLIAMDGQSTANRLGFAFFLVAFTTVLAMITVQLAVVTALPEITTGLDQDLARALRRGLRMIDLGLDVAWDTLGGTAMIFTGWAMRRSSSLRRVWPTGFMFFGTALILLNMATFPQPPGNRGLIDIGPFAAAFLMSLAIRLAFLAPVRESQTIHVA